MHLLPPALSLHQRTDGLRFLRAGRASSRNDQHRRLREGRRASRLFDKFVHLTLRPDARTRVLVVGRVKC